jgi:hypothetical protein
MKAYVVATGCIFGLIVVAHLWRMAAESHALARDPFYVAITALSASLSVWAATVVIRARIR